MYKYKNEENGVVGENTIEKRLQETSRTWGVRCSSKAKEEGQRKYGMECSERAHMWGKNTSLQNCKRFTTQKCQVPRKANVRIETEKWEINKSSYIKRVDLTTNGQNWPAKLLPGNEPNGFS